MREVVHGAMREAMREVMQEAMRAYEGCFHLAGTRITSLATEATSCWVEELGGELDCLDAYIALRAAIFL